MLRKIGDILTIFFLVVILVGAWGVTISRYEVWPSWIGNVVASFTGGILALLGAYAASTWARRVERGKLEHLQLQEQVRPYRDYIIMLYYLLSRTKMAQQLEGEGITLAEMLRPSADDLQELIYNMPPVQEMSLLRDSKLQRLVDDTIIKGLLLLFSASEESLELWGSQCRKVLNKLDEYENPL